MNNDAYHYPCDHLGRQSSENFFPSTSPPRYNGFKFTDLMPQVIHSLVCPALLH